MTTPGTHIRNGNIAGTPERLSENAVKVLDAIFRNAASVSLEEIAEKTSLPKDDVIRHTKLLIDIGLLHINSKFPAFPNAGWRVAMKTTKHQQMMAIFQASGWLDEMTEMTRTLLNGYFPVGLDLEGKGIQNNNGRSYPVGDGAMLINEYLEYKPETAELMAKWKEMKPFQPKEFNEENKDLKAKKFKWLNDKLSIIYGITPPKVVIGVMSEESWGTEGSSTTSSFNRSSNTITLDGKFSVVTFLHEYGHARGFDEIDAILWSSNLYKRTFPVLFTRIQMGGDSHVMIPRRDDFEG